MSEKNYPTRMHEILGVETGEIFKIKNISAHFYLTEHGILMCTESKDAAHSLVRDAINNGIIRKPRLTEAQIKYLRAALTLEFGWVAKDADGSTFLYEGKPKKEQNYWTNDTQAIKVFVEQVSDLVSWSDSEPLDIAATLKAAGVEV